MIRALLVGRWDPKRTHYVYKQLVSLDEVVVDGVIAFCVRICYVVDTKENNEKAVGCVPRDVAVVCINR